MKTTKAKDVIIYQQLISLLWPWHIAFFGHQTYLFGKILFMQEDHCSNEAWKPAKKISIHSQKSITYLLKGKSSANDI